MLSSRAAEPQSLDIAIYAASRPTQLPLSVSAGLGWVTARLHSGATTDRQDNQALIRINQLVPSTSSISKHYQPQEAGVVDHIMS